MGKMYGYTCDTSMIYHGENLTISADFVDEKNIEVVAKTPEKVYEKILIDDCDEEKAYVAFVDMRFKYENQPCPKLSGKYKKLRDDLKSVLAAAKANDCGDDGGTCNFDSAAIKATRWSEKHARQAAKEAGTTCFKTRLFGETWLIFAPPGGGQANRRSRKAKAMVDTFKALGYETFFYQEMD